MAERAIDRLLPTAGALVLGAGTLAAGLGGIAADVMVGRPSAASGVGVMLMFPLVLFAAIVGFAAGYGGGAWLRRRGLNKSVPLGPYRIVLAFVLGVAAVIGATFGARPVLRHERLFAPRIVSGDGAMLREDGAPIACRQEKAVSVCRDGAGTPDAILSNFGEVSVRCSDDGRITMTRPSGEVVGSADLSRYEPLRNVHVTGARIADGGEAMAVLTGFARAPNRHLLIVFNPDGAVVYEEMIAGSTRGSAVPLVACAGDDGSSFVVDLDGKPATYRLR